LSTQLGDQGIDADVRTAMARGWRTWGADADAWFAMVHGELVIDVQ